MEELCFTIENTSTHASREFRRPPFPEEVKPKLSEFVNSAISLKESPFIKNWKRIKGSFQFTNDGKIANNSVLPSDDEIDVFLHRLRPIYLNDEEINFKRIANLVDRHISDQEITSFIKFWRRLYDGSASQDFIEIHVQDKVVNSPEFFDNYINALEYHRDPARRKYINHIAKGISLEAQKSIFIMILGMKYKAICRLSSLIFNCLKCKNGQPIMFRIDNSIYTK
jgi:hypothetical protein